MDVKDEQIAFDLLDGVEEGKIVFLLHVILRIPFDVGDFDIPVDEGAACAMQRGKKRYGGKINSQLNNYHLRRVTRVSQSPSSSSSLTIRLTSVHIFVEIVSMFCVLSNPGHGGIASDAHSGAGPRRKADKENQSQEKDGNIRPTTRVQTESHLSSRPRWNKKKIDDTTAGVNDDELRTSSLSASTKGKKV